MKKEWEKLNPAVKVLVIVLILAALYFGLEKVMKMIKERKKKARHK